MLRAGARRKTALFCIYFLRKGEVLAYVGRIHNLKDLKAGFGFRGSGRESACEDARYG